MSHYRQGQGFYYNFIYHIYNQTILRVRFLSVLKNFPSRMPCKNYFQSLLAYSIIILCTVSPKILFNGKIEILTLENLGYTVSNY